MKVGRFCDDNLVYFTYLFDRGNVVKNTFLNRANV